MNLYEKIRNLYSTLTDADFDPVRGVIQLQNDSDGKGDYIAVWNHPTLAKPTEDQLK